MRYPVLSLDVGSCVERCSVAGGKKTARPTTMGVHSVLPRVKAQILFFSGLKFFDNTIFRINLYSKVQNYEDTLYNK